VRDEVAWLDFSSYGTNSLYDQVVGPIEAIQKHAFLNVSKALPHLKSILFFKQQLAYIPKFYFAGFEHSSEIVELDLKDNYIQNIESGAFASFQNLRILNISGNELIRVCPTQMRENPKLEFISLADNPISAILANAFSGLEHLTHLDLRGSTSIGNP